MADWNAALTDWLKPFVEKLGHKCPAKQSSVNVSSRIL
jgi:hypothetical protein